MVVLHFFIRKAKGRDFLMCEASCSDGSTSPWTNATAICEVPEGEPLSGLVGTVKKRARKAHPDHRMGDVVVPKNGARRFDIVMKRPKGVLKRMLGL